jgi:hypothetical protein
MFSIVLPENQTAKTTDRPCNRVAKIKRDNKNEQPNCATKLSPSTVAAIDMVLKSDEHITKLMRSLNNHPISISQMHKTHISFPEWAPLNLSKTNMLILCKILF